MENIRIGFTGAHSTGKTSVFNVLRTVYPNTNYITKIARSFNIRAKGRERVKVQIDILRAHIHEENHYYSTGFISDRTAIDHMAYFAEINKKYSDDVIRSAYNNIVKNRLRNIYDLIFYFPIEFPIVPDGFRFEDAGFQKTIDRRILLIMKENNVKYYAVTGSINERVEYITSVINKNQMFK